MITRLGDHIQGILWDLDNCLYRDPPGMVGAWYDAFYAASTDFGIRMGRTEHDRLFSEANKKFGNAVQFFVQKYGFDRSAYHASVVGQMDISIIKPDPETIAALHHLHTIGFPMAVVTSSNNLWCARVLAQLGITSLFPRSHIVTIDDTHGKQKSQFDTPFLMAAEVLGLRPNRLLMVDDHPMNLVIPHDLEMTTAHVNHGKPPAHGEHIHHHLSAAHHAVTDLCGIAIPGSEYHRLSMPIAAPVVAP